MITSLLSPFRGRKDLRIDDLVHFAADVVPKVAGPQLRYKVTSIPDARTVRYYIQEGLVDPPLGTAGAAALYGYRHLLQLVLVKVLQAHYLPIRKIRQTIEKLTDRELEKLLESWRSKTPSTPAASPPVSPPVPLRSPHDSVADAVSSHVAMTAPSAQNPPAEAFLRSIAGQTLGSETASDLIRLSTTVDDEAGWARYELYPGIELHVQDGALLPSGSSFLSALASRLRVILQTRSTT